MLLGGHGMTQSSWDTMLQVPVRAIAAARSYFLGVVVEDYSSERICGTESIIASR